MVNLKRAAEAQPSSKSKRSKSSSKTGTRNVRKGDEIAISQIEPPATQQEDETTSLIDAADRLNKLNLQGTGNELWPKEFSKKLKDDQTKVRHKFDAARENIVATRSTFENEFLVLLTIALAPLDANDTVVDDSRPLENTHFAAIDQALHKQSAALFSECNYLIHEYKRLSQRKHEPSRLAELKQSFDDATEATAGAISAGRRATQMDVESLLAHKHYEAWSKDKIDKETEELGRALLASAKRCEEDVESAVGWGSVAHEAHKAAERMQNVILGD